MLYLIISILFLVTVVVLFRAAAESGAEPLGLNTVFRYTGGSLALAGFLLTNDIGELPRLWDEAGWLGITAGIFFWAAGFTAINAIRLGHLGITMTINRCSMVLPTLASILYWKEFPISPVNGLVVLRFTGLAVAVSAIVFMGLDRIRRAEVDASGKPSVKWGLWLAASFFAQGSWETCLRASRSLPDDSARQFFMIVVFVTAMLFSLPIQFAFRPTLRKKECFYGVLAGAASFIGSGIRPWAVRDIDGIIVFPTTNIGVMLLVQLSGAIFWGHKMGRWGVIGLAAAVAGVLCMTLNF